MRALQKNNSKTLRIFYKRCDVYWLSKGITSTCTCYATMSTNLRTRRYARIFMRAYRRTLVGWLCWGLTSQSTIFQSCRDGAIASWVINQYFRGVKCLAQGHNTAAVGFEPDEHWNGHVHTYIHRVRTLKKRPRNGLRSRYLKVSPKITVSRYSSNGCQASTQGPVWGGCGGAIASPLQPLVGQIISKSNYLFT